MNTENENFSSWLEKPIFKNIPKFNIETLIIIIILLVAVISRFYDLGARVMSHDEVNHVVPSYDLSIGKGYKQDPVTHGPLQFHLIALTYFMFGDNDFTSRVPAALASVAAIAVILLAFRRYLGRWGHIIGGVLFLISPFMLFYGRYTRNEGLIEVIGVVMLYATLRYLDRGDHFSLILLTIAQALNFTSKETAYIYMAQLLLFLAIIFIIDVTKEKWPAHDKKVLFFSVMSGAIVLILTGITLGFIHAKQNPVTEDGAAAISDGLQSLVMFSNITVFLAAALGVFGIYILIHNLGMKRLHHLRSFDLLMLNGTLVLPLLSAFPIVMIGSILNTNWTATDYTSAGILRTSITLFIMLTITALLGYWWNFKTWIKNTAIFWSIYTVFYTTFFTWGNGFWTGLVGSLGYWLEQQAVNRGSQPLYYYAFLQMPFYEYLAICGFLVALIYGFFRPREASILPAVPLSPVQDDPSLEDEYLKTESNETEPVINYADTYRVPVLLLFIFWSLTSLVAYSLAGEKMPWLTVHIALPFLFSAAWGFNKLVEFIPWQNLKQNNSWIGLLFIPVLITSFMSFSGALLGTPAPFEGKTLEELQVTNSFVIALIGVIASMFGLSYFLKSWKVKHLLTIFFLGFFSLLAITTARTAFMAAFVNYDTGKEFLVYAHAARGPKDILEQVEEISKRTVGDRNITVAYDNDGLYPYWWYFRDYPNKMWYTDQPTRDLLNAPVILASSENISKIDSLTKNEYIKYDYLRLVWPMQDYYFLTWERIRYAFTDPAMRSALFDIWLNKDYTKYAEIKGRTDLTEATWSPGNSISMYIRNDIIAQIWNYGVLPATISEPVADPYTDKMSQYMPDRTIGLAGDQPGQFAAPRGIAVAQDGSVYVADSLNHRIQHFSPDGTLLHVWGSFGETSVEGLAPSGSFNEPWGVAIGPDGSVYITDTWNHRVQKFTPEGVFITQWGVSDISENPYGFYGPRGIAVDLDGRVFVTDTGNKRISVFDSNGVFITQIGESGFDLGQLDEPVGVAIGPNGEVYVADTWNQRVQVFLPNEDKTTYFASNAWDVVGWNGQSVDNKPFLATDNSGNVYLTDPESFRILGFSPDGNFLRGWGQYSPNTDGFGMPSTLAFDPDNGVWVADAGNNILLHFTLP
ncbi:MAG: hypothetical protein CVU39_24665 [Chloroflexi bacterium HGW-Chloroflexi-10]|nr:MAG: hypothetical protein CVU39_24665 [Chloroflexi bacterium HGW-Chloroflexi-10]